MSSVDDKVMSRCQKVSLPVWHQATPAQLSLRGSPQAQPAELCPTASYRRRDQCGHHSFSGQNDTAKRCPSQWLYLISMLDKLHTHPINIFTDNDKGYPEILLTCLRPCFLVIPIINRCFLALSHPRHSLGSRNSWFSSLMLMAFGPTHQAEETHKYWIRL